MSAITNDLPTSMNDAMTRLISFKTLSPVFRRSAMKDHLTEPGLFMNLRVKGKVGG